MKIKMLLSLILCLSACEPAYSMGYKKAPTPIPTSTPSSSPVPVASPVVSTGVPVLSIGLISGATLAETSMIQKGLLLANEKLASPCFKQWVLAAHYTENQRMSQAQIWAQMVAHPVAVDVEMYTGTYTQNHVYKTVGYENDPFDGVVHMNRYFVNTPFMVADNLWHEAEGHSQGFRHDFVKSTSDPYGMNYAGEGCSNQQQQQQAKGGKKYKPPGIRLEVRGSKWRRKHHLGH